MGSLHHRRQAHRAFLQVEHLEDRLVPSGVEPTAVEQLMLEQLNDARSNPAAYGQSVGVDLSGVTASQPLAWNPLLGASALGHSQDMNANNYFGHIDPSGQNPGQRIANQGYSASDWAESIAAGYTSAADALAGLIVDNGVPGLGHRMQLLSIGSSYQTESQIGVGIVMNGTGQYSNYYTIDTGAPSSGGVFLTGAVFNDVNGNGKYDLGEGLGGVTVTVQGIGSTSTFASGGYTIQVAPGTYSVTASGPGLSSAVTHTVTVGGTNARSEFVLGGSNLGSTIGSGSTTGLGTTAGSGTTAGTNSAQHAADVTFVSQLYLTYLKRAANSGEINTFSTMLDQGATTQASLTTMVKTSQEYRNVCTAWLQQAYKDMLGRGISAGETASWLQYLQGPGTMSSVANAIVTSQEFHQRQWAGWVQDVFQSYLHRSANSTEVANWVTAFQAGATRSNLVAVVVTSGEFQGVVRASNGQFVTALYQDLLGRNAGPTEVAGWVSILNNGTSRSAVAAGFLGSGEYQARQTSKCSSSLYANLLGRPANAQELNALTMALNSGASFESLEDNVLISQEYWNRAAKLAGI